MTNKILIDGWNVAWKIDDIKKLIPDNLRKARTTLNSSLKSYFAGKKSQYKIFYDGKSGITGDDDYVRGIKVQFSQDPEKADHLIIKFLQNQQNTRQWTVITSDRNLSEHVRALGAFVVSSEVFIRKMVSAHHEIPTHFKHNPQLDGEEIQFWIDQFNAGSEDGEN